MVKTVQHIAVFFKFMVTKVSDDSSARSESNGRTNYEVHRRTSAGWQFRTSLPQMDAAIKEAKRNLELPGTEAVRVVRDHYDPVTKLVRPNTVFRAVAAPPEPVKPTLRQKLRAFLPAAAAKPATRSRLVGRLTASLVGVALGTAVTLLHS